MGIFNRLEKKEDLNDFLKDYIDCPIGYIESPNDKKNKDKNRSNQKTIKK